MIVVCVNCNKKFEVNSELIPLEGRNLQCSSCNHVWFFNKGQKETINISETKNNKEISSLKEKNDLKKENTKPLKNKEKKSYISDNKKNSALIEYETPSGYSFGNFLSYILVGIITFIAFIILLDTFKSPLYNIYPNLEFLLFSFFETLKDITLFIKDLT